MKRKQSAKPGFGEFEDALASGKLGPVIILTGDDFLAERALAELRGSIPGGAGDLNYTVFHGDSASGKDIADTAGTYPMFSSKKLVVVKDADRLNARELPALEGYLASPSPATCLVLIYGGGKKPKLPFAAKVSVFDLSPEKGNTVASVMEEARGLGFTISRAGAQALIALAGEDMRELRNELEKLALYKGDGGEIGPREVEALTAKTKFADVYQLINAISRKDRVTAHKVLSELESAGEEPLAILGLITWRFRLMWRAKELADKKTPQAEMIKVLKVSPGQFYYLSEDLKKFRYDELVRIMGRLAECDKKLKLSYVPKSFALTKLIIDLCAKRT